MYAFCFTRCRFEEDMQPRQYTSMACFDIGDRPSSPRQSARTFLAILQAANGSTTHLTEFAVECIRLESFVLIVSDCYFSPRKRIRDGQETIPLKTTSLTGAALLKIDTGLPNLRKTGPANHFDRHQLTSAGVSVMGDKHFWQ